jgi:hypothetical protein
MIVWHEVYTGGTRVNYMGRLMTDDNARVRRAFYHMINTWFNPSIGFEDRWSYGITRNICHPILCFAHPRLGCVRPK